MGRGHSSAELPGPHGPAVSSLLSHEHAAPSAPSPGSHSGSRKFAPEHLGRVPASLCLRMFCSSKDSNLDRNQHRADR